MTADLQRVSTRENPIPCPVTSPGGLPCAKSIEPGWTVEEGHGGGHSWASPQALAVLAGGHYNATAAISGRPFDGHTPADCPGAGCLHRLQLTDEIRAEIAADVAYERRGDV